MIIFSLQIKLPSEKIATTLDTLWRITGRTRAQPGCLSFQVHSDTEDDNTIFLQQVWESRKPMARHIASEDFRNVLAAMDLAMATSGVLRLML